MIREEHNSKKKIHTVNKMVQQAKLTKQYQESHAIRGAIFTACANNLNFVWLYLLRLEGYKLIMPGFVPQTVYNHIYYLIEKMLPDLKELKSIQDIYNYLVSQDGKLLDGHITVDIIKRDIEEYGDYLKEENNDN